jgi:hypothetical protein
MPIYEYQCRLDGTIFEQLMPISWANKKQIICLFHFDDDSIETHLADKIWSLPAKAGMPNDNGKGLIYFENKKGHIEFSSIADKDRWQPEGYIKKEARNLHERDMLERRLRRQDDSRLAEQDEKRDMQRHYSESIRHSEIRNMINQGAVDEKSAALLRRGMERTIKRSRKKRKSELRLSVNHESAGTIRNKK